MTLAVQALTFLMLLSAANEIFSMREPKVSSFPRPLSAEAQEEFDSFTLGDYDFFLGFAIQSGGEFVNQLPPEVGRIYAATIGDDETSDEIELVNCYEYFTEDVEAVAS